jgi:excisionase family DNA binding protein
MADAIPQMLSVTEVARALSVSPYTIRAWVRQGRLRPTRFCRRVVFHPEEVARFLSNATSNVNNSEKHL